MEGCNYDNSKELALLVQKNTISNQQAWINEPKFLRKGWCILSDPIGIQTHNVPTPFIMHPVCLDAGLVSPSSCQALYVKLE